MTVQLELIPSSGSGDDGQEDAIRYDPKLGQWMTPCWAAQAIVENHLGHLGTDDLVIEPSCGTGRFMDALPEGVRSVGIEIDARLAAIAASGAHRTVVVGDFRQVEIPAGRYTAAVGNPPFDLAVFEGMLQRMHGLLDEGAPYVTILPCYMFQTSSRVMRWSERWSIAQTMIPRTVFRGISLPLMVATFTRNAHRRLIGLSLYAQSREIEEMPAGYAIALRERRHGWRSAIAEALRMLGGTATTDQIYREMEPRRPTGTSHWKAQVRKQLGRHFTKVDAATYSLPEAMAA